MPEVIGVVGAGTMGAGIAQLAAAAGARTLLHDPVPDARERGLEQIADGLERWRAKGRLEREPGEVAGRGRARRTWRRPGSSSRRRPSAWSSSASSSRPSARSRPSAVLASNTSSIPITAIASAAADPGRVVGMHFFNPAPVMRLVEVIAGIDSSPEALEVARATGRAMGKEVIDATDGPGFLVNRCNRPFGLEALKLLQERVADVETIDAIVRAAGFRMGPFELQDLVGIDVGYEVSLSFHELSFGEPRWRPSPLSARMVAAGRLGPQERARLVRVPARERRGPRPAGARRRRRPARGAWPARSPSPTSCARWRRGPASTRASQDEAEGEVPWLLIDAGADPEGPPLQGGPVALLCADGSLHGLDGGGGAVGFHVLPPLDGAPLVELTRGPGTARAGRRARRGALRRAGPAHRVGAATRRASCSGASWPSSSTRRASPSARASARARTSTSGWCSASTIRAGPFAWCEAIGAEHVLAVLDGLRIELGEERYRAAPLLRRLAT